MNEKLEKCRQRSGDIFSSKTGDKFGKFFVPILKSKAPLQIMSSPLGESEWDHVSVSLPHRCPTWDEMSMVKKLFWGEDITVVQFHPKKSEYVNNHPYCLHMWRNTERGHELPPSNLTGIKK